MARIFVLVALLVLTACHRESVPFRQVHVGLAGPAIPRVDFLLTSAAVEQSWVKSALNETEWRALLSSIDFDRQMLVAVAIGEREAASGTVKIAGIYNYTGVESRPLNVNVKVGVLREGCKDRHKVSAPFTLVVVPKAAYSGKTNGYGEFNFDDGCRAVVANGGTGS